MIPAAKIMDRGRLMLGLLLIAPIAAVLPTGARSADGSASGPGWTATSEPNPIKRIENPKDVVAALTKKTVQGQQVVTAGDTSKEDVVAAQKSLTDAGEVGSDGTGGTPVKASDPSPATPPGPVPVTTPAVSNYTPPPDTQFVFPVAGGASFTNDWGGARSGGRTHKGIDLFATSATPIVAPIDATVFNVGWNNVGGWRFWLRDVWGNEYYFAHLSAFSPAAVEGSQIRAGTVLGFVGNTGDAKTTPPHLHFEIHPAGGDSIPAFSYVSGWPRVG